MPPLHALTPAQRRRFLQCLALIIGAAVCAISGLLESTNHREPEPYHTSILTGEGWVAELITGHPERIRCELGLHVEAFRQLVSLLRSYGHQDSRDVSLEEQVAIFLYTCITGLPTRHVAERFQHSTETISRYFNKIILILSTAPFYTTYVHRPGKDPVSSQFRNNPKFWPYFQDAVGAVDGSHIPAAPPGTTSARYRDRKGNLSQNCLFACDFDLRFTYALTGWEGSASDARIYDDAKVRGFKIPTGKYILADLGFPSRSTVLVPYRGVRYHLAEWGRAQVRPANKEELFNLRHASARNIIERIFGVLKRRFRILLVALPYKIDTQARIPIALCALHNFIRIHDSDFGDQNHDPILDDAPDVFSYGQRAIPPGDEVGQGRQNPLRDRIATEMWQDYLQLLRERGEVLETVG